MPILRVTLTFVMDKYSWSESHLYLLASSSSTSAGFVPAQQLAQARVPLLGNGATLQRARVTNYPATRQALDIYSPYIVTTPTWPADPTGLIYSASRAFEAILAILQSSDGSQKNLFLAGFPNAFTHTRSGDQSGLDWGAVPDLGSRMAAFNTFITSGGWGWPTRRDSVLSQVQAIVTNAAFPSMIGLVVNAQIPTLQVGSQALAKNFKRINVKLPKLGALWTIGGVLAPVAPATQWTYFLLNSGAVPVNNYKAMGLFGPTSATTRLYTQLNWVGAAERKRGGSLLRPRGRARSRI